MSFRLETVSSRNLPSSLGLRASASDAAYMLYHPRELGRALLSMYVVMPVVAIVLISVLPLPAPVRIALVALAVSPIPPIFPRRVLKAGGREDYVIGLIVAVAALAIIVIPVSLEAVQGVVGVPLRTPLKSVVSLVLLTVLVPLFIGISVHAWLPSLADRLAKPVGLLA